MTTVDSNSLLGTTGDGKPGRRLTIDGNVVWIPANLITDGLVGNWFADHRYVDFGSNSIYDLSNVQNDGSVNAGSPNEVNSIVDSVNFDPGDGITGSLKSNQTESTMSAWIKPNNSTDSRSPIIRPDRHYFQHYNNDRLATYWYGWSNAGYHYSSVGSVPTNVWTHVAVTWDVNSGIQFYINGKPDNSISVTGPGDAINMYYIGRENTSRRFDGEMYDVRLYNRPLSGSEIVTISNNIKLGAVGYLSFHNSDTSGSTALDNSTQGNDGSISSGVTTGQSGPVAESYNFNNSNGVNIGNPATDLNGDLSLAFWCRADNPAAKRETILDKAYGGEFTVNIEQDSSPSELRMYFGDNGSNSQNYESARFSNVFPTGTWTHVVITRDSDTKQIRAYVNGQPHSANPLSYSLNVATGTNPITIGNGYTSWLDGNMSDVRIYNRILSEQERLEIYGE